MAGRIRISFHYRVLLALLTLCWALVGVFLIFQYQREKTFRYELLNNELQMHNSRIIDEMAAGQDIESIAGRISSPTTDLRITIIGRNGDVLYDNSAISDFHASNHNNRPEVEDARKEGTGYTVDRRSERDETEYFYSATLGKDGIVVRSAAPYTHSLRDFLETDSTFLWIMLTVTLIVSFAGYFITRRISTSITRLKSFAEKAGNGERIYDDWAFPHDELGDIAANIVRLHVQRDLKHREALKQEREKIRLKKQLTNNINHELKTPVASIQICAELLRDHPELPDAKRREFVDRICENIQRLSALMQDVASITRMDDGADVIEKETVNLSALIENVVECERLRTEMSITTDIPALEILGNRALLESLFRNLIDNSIAYSGGTAILISADSRGNFTFRDNGAGIQQEHLKHIFERFYRIDKGRSRERGGTGLGLSIVKNAVSIHGGEITVRNDDGLRYDFRLDVMTRQG